MLRDEQPAAAVLKCEEPPRKHACPDALPVITEEICNQNPDKSERDVVSLLSEQIPFGENQLEELKRCARAQAGSQVWKEQRVGYITATKINDF